MADRWRIGFPDDPRYQEGAIYNPYRQNVLKGDYPIFGQHNFLVVVGESESFANARRIPVPSNVSAQRPDSEEFFGRGGQLFFKQTFLLSVGLFHGDTSFKPVDWRIYHAPFNITIFTPRERPSHVTFARPTLEPCLNFLAGAFASTDWRHYQVCVLAEADGGRNSPTLHYSIRAGIQPFMFRFRGWIFTTLISRF